ncbi:penicillin-binding protein [Priestia koreensis]|uniref:penicillin-binding protein n=1 Tax=Priestia koreensis TaxID=284581 RepID=UPI003019FA40
MFPKNKNINTGAAILILIFALLFFILAVRFFYIQATGKAEGETLAPIAQKKYTRQATIEGHRGTIYDRKGKPVAEDTGAYTVVAILDKKQSNYVKNPEKTAEKLAPILKMDQDDLEERLSKKGRIQVELGSKGRDISHSVKTKIENLKLPGIAFIQDSKRFYPNGVFASHIIGYAQKNEAGKIIGKMGIEEIFDKQLTESDGYVKYESAQNGLKLPNPKESIKAPKNGDNIYLTLDEQIQTFVEDALNNVEKEYEPEKAIVVVANPKTGEILGMGNRPSFDPNIRDIQNYANEALMPFEPGSTMKIFTLAAAIQEGVFHGSELYQSGVYNVPNSAPIRDHNRTGWGPITFDEGVQRSSNVAFAMLADRLGADRYRSYLHKFGLDQKTGIDIPGEKSGIISYKYKRDQLTTAFGQGSLISPIQQIQGATAIANGGKMMKPYLIKKVVDPSTNKIVEEHKPTEVGQPVTGDTAKKVLDELEKVVTSEHGTGQTFAIPGYDVAGKTGTAQIPKDNGKGYQFGHGKNIFSFMGFAPKDDPKLIVYVAVKKPKLTPQEAGSAPSALLFKSVMKNSLQYLKIDPEETKKEQNDPPAEIGVNVNSYVGEPAEEAVKDLKDKGLKPILVGKGNQVEDQDLSGERLIKGEKVFLRTNGDLTMPNLTGWSYRDVLRFSNMLELKPSRVGDGYVTSQNLKVGSPVKKDDYLIVELGRPGEDKPKEEKKEDEKKQDEPQE